MLKMLKNIGEDWGNDAGKIVLLKIGVIAYPIIKANERGVNAPLAIIVENEKMAKEVLGEISGFEAMPTIMLSTPKKIFEKSLKAVKYELIPILCNAIDKHNIDNLKTLKSAMIAGEWMGEKFTALPVITFIGGIPKGCGDYLAGKVIFTECHRNQREDQDEIVRKLIDRILNNASTIENKLKKIQNGDVSFINSAKRICDVLMGYLLNNKIPKEIGDFERTAEKVKEEWEIEDDFKWWLEIIRERIMKKSEEIGRIIDRNNVSDEELKMIGKYPLYDERFYFFSQEFFEEICGNMLGISSLELKRELADAGILICQGEARSYFTVKVSVATVYGIQPSGRRLRILREWLDLPGELSWKEKIEMNGRRRTND